MAVDGVIYQRGEWNDPAWRYMKEQLPPWLQHPVAGSGWGRPKGVAQSPGKGIVIDHQKSFWEEQERMKENKETSFVFLIEEERRAKALRVEAQREAEARRAEEAQQEAEARRAEEQETDQQEVLHEPDYQGETTEPGGADETHPGDELQAVLEATGKIDLNGGSQHEMEARTEEVL